MRALLPALFVLLVAMPAKASDVFLRWDACGPGGASLRTFACNTNSGEEVLVSSFVLTDSLPQVNGMQTAIKVDFVPSLGVPSWWNVTNCRPSTSIRAWVTPAPAGCVSPWPAIAFGGSSYAPTRYSSGSGLLRAVFAVPEKDTFALEPSVEYLAHRFTISHAKTVGTGACSGCALPAGFSVLEILLTRNSALGNLEVFPTRDSPPNFHVTWQCPGTPVFMYGSVQSWAFSGCTVPTRRPTWGSIKSLFR